MRRDAVFLLVLVAGCRYGFDPLTTDAGGTDSNAGPDSPLSAITFTQVKAFDSNTSMASINVTLPQPQQAGDLNIAVVAWGDTLHGVSSISDTAGNSYTLAIGPTINTCDAQSIYYAPNIVGTASNKVTVTFDATITFPTLLVLEYAGPSSVDQTASGTGSVIVAASTPVTTTVDRELVFGAGVPDNCAPPNFAGAGASFNNRIITSVSGMLAEDIIATQIGTFAATGNLTQASPWVMQIVTFK